MGFHFEEEFIADGTIDNRIKGRTVLRINFTNHTSSLVTLQGNPCRDLAGSLWSFRNPHARMDDLPGEQCFFIPALCEGTAGHISYSKKREIPILPPEEHYARLFDDEEEDPPTRIAPVLELEWFSEKYKRVEIDCAQMILELVEMDWSLSAEEAAAGAAVVGQIREEIRCGDEGVWDGFDEDMDLMEEYGDEDPEPHELEELCFLIVQEFVFNSADGSDAKQQIHNHLLELQDQIAEAFIHLNHEGEFGEIPETVSLLTSVLPFIDRAAASARFLAEETYENLLHLRNGIVALRDELAGSGQG